MAKKKNKKTTSGIFDKFKLSESYTSLALGAIIVLIAGILFFSFARLNRDGKTSSTQEGPSDTMLLENSKTSSTYTIKPGDDLWSISENIYKDGYKWIEIAKANKLENPGLIHVGNKLTIPSSAPTIVQKTPPQADLVKNSSITANIYKIKQGDNLWEIAVRAYGDGYRWPDIAKVNNLENPNLIFSDNILKIPR